MFLRLFTSALLIPVLVASIWAGGIFLTVLMGITAVVATSEFGNLKKLSGDKPSILVAIIGTLLLICLVHNLPHSHLASWLILELIAIISIVTVPLLIIKHRYCTNFLNILITVGILVYCGGLIAHSIALRNLDHGANWLYLVFAVTFINDTAALIFGKLFGSRLLIPSISPNKTWEGALAGLVFSLMGCGAAFNLLNIPHDTWEPYTLGLIIAFAGQAGDLFISRLKRLAQVKDSGWIIPGHGGVLDRIDSIVPSLVVVYYFAL